METTTSGSSAFSMKGMYIIQIYQDTSYNLNVYIIWIPSMIMV